jgi:hypothetical protein
MSVGVTKDYKLKVRNLHASHTLEDFWVDVRKSPFFTDPGAKTVLGRKPLRFFLFCLQLVRWEGFLMCSSV